MINQLSIRAVLLFEIDFISKIFHAMFDPTLVTRSIWNVLKQSRFFMISEQQLDLIDLMERFKRLDRYEKLVDDLLERLKKIESNMDKIGGMENRQSNLIQDISINLKSLESVVPPPPPPPPLPRIDFKFTSTPNPVFLARPKSSTTSSPPSESFKADREAGTLDERNQREKDESFVRNKKQR
ncbi:hypothetical protein QR98_0105390 [Sarcoptes scabiei]|uniref:Uncharacterized protein n=1 Tax=Sarcoptes scabiei TaxID=52283 RepID=A0A132AM81_SARSC|nr:hypothetical protein QR98_0105390 [Sarcoptes scabiei]